MRDRKELANALRILTVDAVEQAKSGHPGGAMGMADMAEALWHGVFKHNPANPKWADRDRFVLSNGHASMLLYGLLHLTGYDLGMDEIRRFRQLGSRTPGHPEYGKTAGVEMTTGPLGQGLASAVGMALAEKLLAAAFNRPDLPIVDHYTYVFAGDGCLMEGVSQEACSLAGTLGLNKLIVLYDANGISIDGRVDDWFTDNTPERFAACGWHVISDVDGHDGEALDAALTMAREVKTQPSLICCRTIIAYGAPNKCDTAESHGAPLGPEEALATKMMLGWQAEPFSVPADIRMEWDARPRGAAAEEAWNALFGRYRQAYPDLAAEFERRMAGDLPQTWAADIAGVIRDLAGINKPLATRQASGEVLNILAGTLPELFGGSADLSTSVHALHKRATTVKQNQWQGNYLYYGVREFLMACAMNGLTLHGGFIPYGGTFLVFSDYMWSGLRLCAMMGLRVIHVLSHDSIGVGEDGPTHQPMEQTPGLRLIPGLDVWRPADAVETAVAWKCAVERKGPSALILSRQALPQQRREADRLPDIERGGYILRDCEGLPEAVVIATGSEVHIGLAAVEQLQAAGRRVRLVSMPCTERFDEQDAAWRDAVLPASVRARVAVEAAACDGWHKYVGLDGRIVGMRDFGVSGPGAALFVHFDITADAVVRAVEACLA